MDSLLHYYGPEGCMISATVNFVEMMLSLLGEFSEVHRAPNSKVSITLLAFITNCPAFARRA